MQQGDEEYAANGTDVSKFLPRPEYKYEVAQESIGNFEFTNIFQPNGTLTRLFPDDAFWAPACGRMLAELTRLYGHINDPVNAEKTMGVTLKHYGMSPPDAANHTQPISTYVSVNVLDFGSDMLAAFNESCAWWFGDIVALASTDSLPGHYLATAGGAKAAQAVDGSNFTMWVEPFVSVASD